MSKLEKVYSYARRNGMKKTIQLAYERNQEKYNRNYDYIPPDSSELRRQCENSVFSDEQLPIKPLISIIVPAYETSTRFMRELLESVAAQSYPYWQLIIADGSDTDKVESVVRNYAKETSYPMRPILDALCAAGMSYEESQKLREAFDIQNKIKYIRLQRNGGISVNSNQALAYVEGDYVALLDHDDIITVDALYEIVKEINDAESRGIQLQMIYSDEDKCDENGENFYEPNIKPEFNLDLLLSNNYICHFLVMKTDLIKMIGFRKEFDGAQDYDCILRSVDRIEESVIGHVSKVLYHWRCHIKSTAENPKSKLYAYEAGKRAVEAFLQDKKIRGTVQHTEHLGFYRVEYEDFFADRPQVYAIGGSLIDKKGSIVGGPMDEKGICPYQGYRHYYSGPGNRASVVQQVKYIDARTMLVRPQWISRYEEIMGVPYIPDLKARDKTYMKQMSEQNWREKSMELCTRMSRESGKILWDPKQQVQR